jgi:hypothetical protein
MTIRELDTLSLEEEKDRCCAVWNVYVVVVSKCQARLGGARACSARIVIVVALVITLSALIDVEFPSVYAAALFKRLVIRCSP